MKTLKTTKLFVALLALSILSLTSAFSQNKANDLMNKTPEDRAKVQTEMMKNKLNLSTEQQTKIEAINLNYAKKFEPVIKSSDSKLTRYKRAKSLQKAKNEELKKVLTTSQYQRYEKSKETLKSTLKDKM